MRMTVKDVMTTDVVAVNASAEFHVVAEILINKRVSGVPVLDDDDHVLGVVSEADLLAKEEFKQRYYGDFYHPPLRARLRHHATARKAEGETVGQLMSAPAVVASPFDSVVAAARLMDARGVKRLPVVDPEGRPVGLVSRHDLLKVFVRGDEDIRRRVVDGLPLHAVPVIDISVRDGLVTLTGQTDKHSEADIAARHAESVDGVVAVHDELTWKEDDLLPPITTWGGA